MNSTSSEADRCDLRHETARVEEETVEPSDGVVDRLGLGQTYRGGGGFSCCPDGNWRRLLDVRLSGSFHVLR